MTPMDIFRWIAYQWCKALRRPSVSIGGVKLAVSQSMPRGVRRSLYRGDYEAAERQLVAKYLLAEDKVLEIGAGIGLISLTCARIAYRGHVVSYEANPRLADDLSNNVALNGSNIEVRNRAVARNAGSISFHVHDRFISSSLIQREGSQRITVKSDCFGDIVARFRPTALVMDIEGAETDVLLNADLNGVRVVILEVHPHITGNDAVTSLISYLYEVGFQTIERQENVIVFERPRTSPNP